MRGIKSGSNDASRQSDIVVLSDTPHLQGLVKANRLLLLLASSLMVIVFLLGFLLLPADDVLDGFKAKDKTVAVSYSLGNPVLSAEINTLKGQLVGLISGSIESKLRTLESNIKSGSIVASMGTIQDLRNDVNVLQAYSVPGKRVVENQVNQALVEEVSQLKRLIYLTLTSCGLMIVAIVGFWVRSRYRLAHLEPLQSEIGKR